MPAKSLSTAPPLSSPAFGTLGIGGPKEHPKQQPGSMEEIPEDLRCKRSDGKQWRCSALSMPDKTVCKKHYIQAKKRAANSALRASLKKARRADTITYPGDR